MKKNKYIHFLKISIFIYSFIQINNDIIAASSTYNNKYNPIGEMDEKRKKEITSNALKRFVNPFYVYYNGETSEKLFFTFTILGSYVFYKLTKNKNTGEREGTALTNIFLHLFLCAFFAQWLVIGPAKVFIDGYLEEYDRKFKAKL